MERVSELSIILFTIAILSLAGFGQSRSITGKVNDSNDAAIAGATVVLRDKKTGLERVVSTDKNGEFSFTVTGSGPFEAVVSADGFGRVQADIDAGTRPVFTLEPAAVSADVVVVSGSRQEELRESLSTKVDVLTRRDITTTGYESAGEALREVPGVITRRGSETSGVAGEQVQGIDSRQVLVLLDGQPVVGARGIKGGVINLDRQSTDRLESIEVVKGSASALYGSDAIGGVINLRTREQTTPFTANFSVAAGSYGVFDGKSSVGFLKKKLSGIFSLERHKNNGFDFDPLTFQAEGAGFHRYDSYGRLKYAFNEHFSLTAFANSYWNYAKGRVIGEQGTQTNNVNDDSQNYGLTADWAVDGLTNVQIRGYFSRYDEITRGALYPSNTVLPDGNLFERFGKVDATFTRIIGDRNLLQAGVEFMTDRYSGLNRLRNDGAKASTRVAWAQDKINITDRLTLTLGARFDNHSAFGNAFSPKAGVNFRVNDSISFRASWGKGFRAPDIGQLYYRFSNPAGFYQIIGNPGLRPETAGSWQLGGEYNARSRNLHIGVNLFRNDVRNLINYSNLGVVTTGNVDAVLAANGIDPALKHYLIYNVMLFYYKNIANVYTQGVEFDTSYRLPHGFSVSAAYTYLEAFDRKTHRYLTGRNRHHGFVKFGYDNARYGFDANLRGSLYSKWIASRVESTNAETIVPAFQLWDLYAAKRLRKGFELYGTVENLFNDRDPNRGQPTQQRLEVGRTFRVGIRWTYDRKQ